MALGNNIIDGIISDFLTSKDKVVEEIKKGLTRPRAGLRYPHTFSGKTENNIEVQTPSWNGNKLTWDFDSQSGSRLNLGLRNKKVNIAAIVDWVNKKHNIYGSEAKRFAYHIIKKMDENQNPKRTGWFDEVQPNVERKVNSIIEQSMIKNINLELDKKLNKTIK